MSEPIQLTEAQQEIFRHHIASIGRPLKCPICGHNGFSYSTYLYVAPSITDDDRFLPDYSVPMVHLKCDDCRHLMWFAVAQMFAKYQSHQDANAPGADGEIAG